MNALVVGSTGFSVHLNRCCAQGHRMLSQGMKEMRYPDAPDVLVADLALARGKQFAPSDTTIKHAWPV